MNRLASLVRQGNKKLPSTTAIFNLGPAHDCPARWRDMCPAINQHQHCICYALRDELQWPHIIDYRRRQLAYWLDVSADRFVQDFHAMQIERRDPFTALRIGESGDFGYQQDVDKAEAIARTIAIPVYCYTARSDLDYTGCRSLVVNASGWTPQPGSGVRGEFRLVYSIPDLPLGFDWCPRSCKNCDRCVVGKRTAVLVWWGANAKRTAIDTVTRRET